jgi:hypothetical protein
MSKWRPQEGDLVIVTGSTRNKTGVVERHRTLASVIAVGRGDVFVKSESRDKIFRTSIDRCSKVDEANTDPDAEMITPKLGDLVTSVVDRYSKTEKRMGVLIEISDVPGSVKMAKLLKGETSENVSFDSLIVVE